MTVPLPLPDAPVLIVIHGALDVAVHVQPAPAVTVTATLPSDSPTPTLSPGALIANAHAAAACTMV